MKKDLQLGDFLKSEIIGKSFEIENAKITFYEDEIMVENYLSNEENHFSYELNVK